MNFLSKVIGWIIGHTIGLLIKAIIKCVKALIKMASGKNKQQPVTQEPVSEAQADTVTTDSNVWKVK